MDILQAAKARYTTKSFDPERKLAPGVLEALCEVLRLSPSSVNAQPWHFIVATTDAGKERIARATGGAYAYNRPKVINAAAVLVICARTNMSEQYMGTLLAQEEHDGRFRIDGAKAGQQAGREKFVGLHRDTLHDLQGWIEKQVYLALGMLVLGAAALEVDACSMEGFDAPVLDEEFDLPGQELTSIALVSLGYRSADDFNAGLPKSRLPQTTTFTFL